LGFSGLLHGLGTPHQGAMKYGWSDYPSIEPMHHIMHKTSFFPTRASNYRKGGLRFIDYFLQMLVPGKFGV